METLAPGAREQRLAAARNRVAASRVVGTRDELTGLLNRRSCDAVGRSVLAWANRHDEPMSLLLIRLHEDASRDRIVLSLADALRSLVDDGDVAARTAPREFAVLLADAGAARAEQFVAEALGALEQWDVLDGRGALDVLDVATVTSRPGIDSVFAALFDRALDELDEIAADLRRLRRVGGEGEALRNGRGEVVGGRPEADRPERLSRRARRAG